MIVVVDSLTGQSKLFAKKLGFIIQDINKIENIQEEDIFLITRSFNFGQIPDTTKIFLEKYSNSVIGTAVSGNKNWGSNFGKAGDKIEEIYKIPLVLKFEGTGFPSDIVKVKKWISNFYENKKI